MLPFLLSNILYLLFLPAGEGFPVTPTVDCSPGLDCPPPAEANSAISASVVERAPLPQPTDCSTLECAQGKLSCLLLSNILYLQLSPAGEGFPVTPTVDCSPGLDCPLPAEASVIKRAPLPKPSDCSTLECAQGKLCYLLLSNILYSLSSLAGEGFPITPTVDCSPGLDCPPPAESNSVIPAPVVERLVLPPLNCSGLDCFRRKFPRGRCVSLSKDLRERI